MPLGAFGRGNQCGRVPRRQIVATWTLRAWRRCSDLQPQTEGVCGWTSSSVRSWIAGTRQEAAMRSFLLLIATAVLCGCTHSQPERAGPAAATPSERRVAAETTRYDLQGLSADAEIVVDRWGIPHIYAQSENDLFF